MSEYFDAGVGEYFQLPKERWDAYEEARKHDLVNPNLFFDASESWKLSDRQRELVHQNYLDDYARWIMNKSSERRPTARDESIEQKIQTILGHR